VLPGARAPRFEIAVIIDTSASVTDAEVSAALAEVTAVQRQCGIRQLWAITCDTEPSAPQRVRAASGIELLGGGGTDLRPAIALLATLRPRPDVAIVITDGWTPWPDRPPRGTALVVATTDRPCPLPGVRTVQIDLDVP
jgi:predicted metal-dependent peptidase